MVLLDVVNLTNGLAVRWCANVTGGLANTYNITPSELTNGLTRDAQNQGVIFIVLGGHTIKKVGKYLTNPIGRCRFFAARNNFIGNRVGMKGTTSAA